MDNVTCCSFRDVKNYSFFSKACIFKFFACFLCMPAILNNYIFKFSVSFALSQTITFLNIPWWSLEWFRTCFSTSSVVLSSVICMMTVGLTRFIASRLLIGGLIVFSRAFSHVFDFLYKFSPFPFVYETFFPLPPFLYLLFTFACRALTSNSTSDFEIISNVSILSMNYCG